MSRSPTLWGAALACGLITIVVPAQADDPDYGAPPHEAAERRQAQRREAERERQTQAMKRDAELRYYRGGLGAKASGKSDAEVLEMGKRWKADTQRQADAAQRQYSAQPKPDVDRVQATGAMRQTQVERIVRQASGGKRGAQDLADLSDAELEALARNAARQLNGH